MPHENNMLVMIKPISNLFKVGIALLPFILEQIKSAIKLGTIGVEPLDIGDGDTSVKLGLKILPTNRILIIKNKAKTALNN